MARYASRGVLYAARVSVRWAAAGAIGRTSGMRTRAERTRGCIRKTSEGVLEANERRALILAIPGCRAARKPRLVQLSRELDPRRQVPCNDGADIPERARLRRRVGKRGERGIVERQRAHARAQLQCAAT